MQQRAIQVRPHLMRLERDEQGAPAILLTYSVDITARKEAEEALQRAKDDL
ncbi:MAG: hypothetical protein HC807_03685, partial [Gammaproteobacteria bacterium]|nr:hypothetical protein [Gammaproteobacteria bacterium]